jgi:hypothetical protein
MAPRAWIMAGIWLLGILGQTGVTLTPFVIVSGLLWGFRISLAHLVIAIAGSFAATELVIRAIYPRSMWRQVLWNAAALSSGLLLIVLVRAVLNRSPFELRAAELVAFAGATGLLISRVWMFKERRAAAR